MIDLATNAARCIEASARLAAAALPPLAPRVADGARAIVDSLLQGGRILTCGSGSGAALAQYMATLLLNQFQRERPALPAISLNADSTLLSAICGSFDHDELFSRQVRGLGKGGDMLLAICPDDDQEPIVAAVQAAREQQMKVIVLTGGARGRLSGLLGGDDIDIHLSGITPAQARELQLILLHTLCELIDQQLLGSH
ncbi:MAG TPA: SIS domain-containing protein [Sedimenticola thiotaurini]|uniref:SIS domain-containing protein n=1 Tax=Sedimenticola thiotaurini TaxID=1543721 RepID=A0A831RNA1_9GAMM|nr:SIS domain-containing protein [Sedimenticola thiotaurini]